uniref:Uncharacterized protein n=1 Tax=Setaria italica TaxID=4555 RepID=K3YZI9_SETIT
MPIQEPLLLLLLTDSSSATQAQQRRRRAAGPETQGINPHRARAGFLLSSD